MTKVDIDRGMIEKEIAIAALDLDAARNSIVGGNAKWASTQSYYSMFHSVKAIVLAKGFREKSHWCLLVALRELLVGTGELDGELADDFELCMGIRHEADYALRYDEVTATRTISMAERMLDASKRLLERAGFVAAGDGARRDG
jgi:uncharacterized protein (UPF0332 family)